MKFKNTLLLFAAFLVVLAVVLVFEHKGNRDKAAKEKAEKLVDLASEDVEKITLKTGAGALSFKKDEDGDWMIQEPIQTRADGSEVRSLAESFSSLRIERVVESEAKDPAAYEIPKTEVSLWTKGREEPVTVLIGMENPLDGTLFAKRADAGRVVLLASYLKTTIDKKLFDFREKAVFKYATADVKGVRLRAKDIRWEASRKEDRWFLTKPVQSLAAQSKIESLLDALSNLKAKEFISEEKKGEEIRRLGLDKAEYEVVLSMPLANQETVFSIHKAGDRTYAASSSMNKLVAVDDLILSDLAKKPEDLREKKVAGFSSWEADRVLVRKGALSLAAVKEKVQDEDKWRLETPAGEAADGSKIEAFLRKIEVLEAASFVDPPFNPADFGMAPPEAEVEIRVKESGKEAREVSLFIGKEDPEKKQIVIKNPSLDYLFRVDAAFLDDFPKELKDWKAEEKTESAADKAEEKK
ncbi:MAG TPA: DUF4340 domain-containing protein [Candidatus Aminicenantes bacterium]|nr:DUF4340 domain-containing protein [Candidatus Aminicenantes bacterium]